MTQSDIAQSLLESNHTISQDEGSDHAELETIRSEALHQEYFSLKSTTTFRDDVRNEWIQAVFGTDFPSCAQSSNKPYQGMGLAQVAPYMAYSVTIPICTSQDKVMGISISRLSLGLYVRHITPGSEAWCAGIIPNSVLVAINGMSLLAEPSKQALERLWQYEGHFQVQQVNQSSSTSLPAPHHPPAGMAASGSKLVPEEFSLSNRQPLHMTLIYQGRIYSSLLLSNPPYGIDWAPCGNFALVKRSYAHAQEAGVVKGSIIASINATNDFNEMDHTLAAATLRNLFVNRQEIQITLCIPPSEARSGHFERLLDAKELNLSPTPSTSKHSMPNKTQRQQVMAELDGVEVRVHPILFSACSLRSSNIVSNAAMNLSQLAFRVAAGELFSFPQRGKYQYFFSQRYYRSCPPLDQPLHEVVSSNHALLYLLEYFAVNYDETKLAMGRFINLDRNSVVLSFLKECSRPQVNQLLQIFLLQILAVLRLDGIDSGSSSPLSQFLFSACQNDIDLCHRMEFMAQAQGLGYIKDQMTKLRKQRQQKQQQQQEQRREPRQIPFRVESAPCESPVAATSVVTGTTASVMTPSSSIFSGKNMEEALPLPTKRLFGFFRKKKRSNHRKKRSSASVDQQPKVNHTTHIVNTCDKPGVHKHADVAANIPPNRAETSLTTIPKDELFANTLAFLEELEAVCLDVEKSLLRSFSQKIAGWALTPWSASKETELAQVTQVMRERLQKFPSIPLLNPIDSDTLVAVDAQGSYILPSAHFPLLLTFDCQDPSDTSTVSKHAIPKTRHNQIFGKEIMYRTKVELVALVEKQQRTDQASGGNFMVHGAVGGTIMKSGLSIPTNRSADRHAWDHGNVLTFDSRTSWGAPNTLSLLLSQSTDTIVAADENGRLLYEKKIGVCFVDLASAWERLGSHASNGNKATESFQLKTWSRNGIYQFDSNGEVTRDTHDDIDDGIELQIRITLQKVHLSNSANGVPLARKCSLLYKHDDDMLQELFAIEFVKSCDRILKSCGLDLRLLTFRCIPVGRRRGFIEWIQGAVPISEICQPFAGSILDGNKKELGRLPSINGGVVDHNSQSNEDPMSSVAKAGLTKYESLWRMTSGQDRRKKAQAHGGCLRTNIIQDFLRSFHFSPTDPYLIRKDVLETYVKSCAGYCVITYILGVGDRHLDNLLLHPTGHFFHCDYSFILGHDPKKYLPLRITEDMVNGMGGRESDNYAKFLSLTCASFLTFRRPENVRHLMSFVRLMDGCCTDNASMDSKQSVDTTMTGIRERLLLDLSDEEAISFMENLVDESCSSRMWMAVDAIHTLGKRF